MSLPTQLTGVAPNTSFVALAIDYDDANVPTTMAQVMDYDNAVVIGPTQECALTLKPKFAVAAYASGVFTSYASSVENQWIDCASTGVEYYGLKIGVQAQNTANPTMNWRLFVRYHLEFRGMR